MEYYDQAAQHVQTFLKSNPQVETYARKAADLYVDDSSYAAVLFTWLPIISLIHNLAEIPDVRPYVKRENWPISLAITFLRQSGGTSLCHIFLWLPPSFLSSHTHFPLVFALWYLIHYFPIDIFYPILTFRPIKLLLSLGNNVWRGRTIVKLFLTALKQYPGNYSTAVVAVIMFSMPGELSTTLLNQKVNPNAPSFLQKPSWSVQSAVLSGLALALNDHLGWFSWYTMTVSIILVLQYQTLMSKLTGSPFVFPFSWISALTNELLMASPESPSAKPISKPEKPNGKNPNDKKPKKD